MAKNIKGTAKAVEEVADLFKKHKSSKGADAAKDALNTNAANPNTVDVSKANVTQPNAGTDSIADKS